MTIGLVSAIDLVMLPTLQKHAERAGVSKQSVTRIENGTMDPRFSTITALYQAIRLVGVELEDDANGIVQLTVSRKKLLAPSG